MSNSNQELEIKLYIADLSALKRQLEALGAQIDKPRVHEYNLRFDTRDGQLTKTAQVLRLRQDTTAKLTYKGPGELVDGVLSRKEIEFTISDFDAARNFFQALGYQVSVIYEKYRTTYELQGVEVTLDEMPYGNFAEIEGVDTKTINAIADRLGVNRFVSVASSYTALFDRLCAVRGFTFRDLTFENFENLEITDADIGVTPADQNK
jgi:adenylate cyclase class 2